jgi:hypothetical protein
MRPARCVHSTPSLALGLVEADVGIAAFFEGARCVVRCPALALAFYLAPPSVGL